MRRKNIKSGYCNDMVCFLRYRGGTLINIIVAIIFFGLIGYGVLWVIRQTGEAGQEYAQGMVNTTNKATAAACTMNMRTIWTSIQMYSITNDGLPESFAELVSEVGDSRVFQCPEPNSPKYEYIPGQTLNSPGENILLYEPKPVHSGMCNVLRVSGAIELITPEELQAALEQTKAHLRR
ncbi:MAG: hypothetical protein JW787_03535 [Sedimentisphaerales bacterium]|nr:hypothetical protein [Sedimentisphaerales bacterium]